MREASREKRGFRGGTAVSRSLARSCVVFGVMLLLVSASTVQGETVNLGALADNWISSCSSGSLVNNGGQDELRVRSSWWGSAGDREPKNFRSLLSFDLADLPEDEDLITQANLGLYYFDKPDYDPVGHTYEVHRIVNEWDEMNSTWLARDDYSLENPVYWDSYDAGQPPYQPGGGDFATEVYASAVTPADVGQWMTWDVTELVKEWVGETHDDFGLLIRDSVEIESDPGGGTISYHARFRSSEFSESEFHPFLEVTYVPEPASLVLMVLGAAMLRRFS